VAALDLNGIRAEFPVLYTMVRGKPLAYLDNAATTQKPWAVINRMREFETREYATIHRGVYRLSERATEGFEDVRRKTALFINAQSSDEIVFTSGATMGINLVAGSWGRKYIGAGDEILISHLEHHANIVPWQILAEEKGAIIKVIPVNDDGDLILEEYYKLLSPKTKIVAVTHVANSIGTINPVKEICAKAKAAGAVTLVDGAQAAPHMKIDIQDIGCDFYLFSAHKMYGPTGLGILFGRREILNQTPPFLSGGDMIEQVTFKKTTFAKPPHRFEAGTPPISQVIGFGATLDFLNNIGMNTIEIHEGTIMEYATKLISNIEGVRILGAPKKKAALISFTLSNAHPHDVATILDSKGIAVRAGHHCAQPALDRFGVSATTRASFSFYNTLEEVERLVEGIVDTIELFGE
jgi:cysteine desulfurase/selenocysteine lyase